MWERLSYELIGAKGGGKPGLRSCNFIGGKGNILLRSCYVMWGKGDGIYFNVTGGKGGGYLPMFNITSVIHFVKSSPCHAFLQ